MRFYFKLLIDYLLILFLCFFFLSHRMWSEIREKSKLSLITVYMYLASDKLALENDNSILAKNGTNSDSHLQRAMPETIANRWKCINDVYIENGFISNDIE